MGSLARHLCALAAPLLACAGLSSCSTGFVDATPPVLRRLDLRHDARLDPLPIAYGVIFDLQLSSDRCARARKAILDNLSAQLSARGATSLLVVVDLSEGCVQNPYRQLDLTPVTDALTAARAQLAPRPLRPVFVYFNNVDLPISADITAGLNSLPTLGAADATNPALLWAVTVSQTLGLVTLDAWAPWSYFDDPKLLDPLKPSIEDKLPFTTINWDPLPRDLFSPELLATVRAFKVCGHDSRISSANFPLDGSARLVNPDYPPFFDARVAPATAIPASAVEGDALSVEIEACTDRCDRWVDLDDGTLIRWLDHPGCTAELSQ